MPIHKALATVGIALACAAAAVSVGDVRQAAAADERPNVVVLYVDDVNPKTPWLWGKRERTPNLARFHRQGVEFRNAVGSTPLCGPSRATLLTGQYSHNHGVVGNGLHQFDPSRTLATELRGVGYHTILAGKYGNGIEEVAPTRQSVKPYARGWDDFDIIWKRPIKGKGQFYDYKLWTRDGVIWKGSASKDHSTYVVGKRVARHIREAPAGDPLFAVASLNSGHVPNTPLRWHRGSAKCAGVSPYRAPSFNERDVTDKPAFIRNLPRLGRSSFGLRGRCEEYLGVEGTLRQIRQALRETGRLQDTLFIFTADNGYLMGDHRMPGKGSKYWPHAVPVPFYALWPAVLGNERRVVKEPISSVDLPVTICALAGCTLEAADGRNIAPLLTGARKKLEREFLYLEMLRPYFGMKPWYGLITTRSYDRESVFHYVEYKSGARELYNLSKDPHRLNNLARKPWQANRIKNLHRMLHNRIVKPDGVRLP
jgi:arylsulfatase A-like enzyme